MAAYAALVSVMHIIENLENHPRPPITIDEAQTRFLTEKIAFLQDFLESYHFHGGSEQLESLQSRIADVAHAAEDVIESHIVDQIDPCSRSARYWEDASGLPKLTNGMDFIKREAMKIIQEKVDITEQTHNHPCPPIALDEKQAESVKIASSDGEETSCFERLQKRITKGMSFIKRKVMEILKEKVDFTELTHKKKQVESEKIKILQDIVESCNSYEVRCLFNRIAVEDSIKFWETDQIFDEKIGMLQALFGAYNSYGDECLQTRIVDAAYAAGDNISILDLIRDLSIDTHGDGKNASSFDFYKLLQQVIKDMDLIEREVKEIRNKVGLNDRLCITAKATVVS